MAIARPADRQVRYMTNLTSHMRKCYTCKAAVRTGEGSSLCPEGNLLCLQAAKGFDALGRLHSAAFRHEGKVVYGCPDPKKHSLAYQMTAVPMMVSAFQDELF